MKYLLLTAVLFTPGLAAAGDTTKNPDRYVSVGFDYNYGSLPHGVPGLLRYDPAKGQNIVTDAKQSIITRNMTLDVRAPVNDWLTLTAHGGPWEQESYSGESKGYMVGGGARVYFTGHLFDD